MQREGWKQQLHVLWYNTPPRGLCPSGFGQHEKPEYDREQHHDRSRRPARQPRQQPSPQHGPPHLKGTNQRDDDERSTCESLCRHLSHDPQLHSL